MIRGRSRFMISASSPSASTWMICEQGRGAGERRGWSGRRSGAAAATGQPVGSRRLVRSHHPHTLCEQPHIGVFTGLGAHHHGALPPGLCRCEAGCGRRHGMPRRRCCSDACGAGCSRRPAAQGCGHRRARKPQRSRRASVDRAAAIRMNGGAIATPSVHLTEATVAPVAKLETKNMGSPRLLHCVNCHQWRSSLSKRGRLAQ